MRPTFKKLEVKDIADLERLVAENVEGIEPGLKVIDSRLLLGQAAIDLVGLDAKGALVLIALDFTADESLLLRVMDAYSWCLEYPETIRRLYPMARVSPERPPRILFIVERLSESFRRRIKALSFLEIDCLEFRHLEVDGTSALYFELVQRLRKSAPTETASPEPTAGQTAGPTPTPPAPAPDPGAPPPSVPPPPQASAAPAPRPAAPPSPTAALAPTLVEPRGPGPRAEDPDVGAPPDAKARVAVDESPEIEMPLEEPVNEARLAATSRVEGPAAPELPAPATGAAASLEQHLAGLVAAASAALARGAAVPAEALGAPEDSPLRLESAEQSARQTMAERVRANPEWQALLNSLRIDLSAPGPSAPVAEAPSALAEEGSSAPVEEAASAPAAEAAGEPAPAVVEVPPTPPVWAKPADKPVAAPGASRTYFFAQAAKSGGPAEREPAPPAPAAKAAPPAQPVAPPAQPAAPPAQPAAPPAQPAAPPAQPAAPPAQPAAPPAQPAAPPAQSAAPPAQPAAPSAQPAAPPAQPVAPPAQPAAPPAEPPASAAGLKGPASPEIAGRPEFEALEFPKDGLSQQWLEFLNQLGATK